MKSIKGTETEKNLLRAFAGESQARNRYTIFADVARNEGYEQIADFFDQTAHNEYHHAKIFFGFLEGGNVNIDAGYPAGKIGITSENLLSAAEGEHEEFTSIYPAFADVARQEGFVRIANAFDNIAKIEKEHEERFRKLLENVEGELVFKRNNEVIWICRVCGHIHVGLEAPKACPVCLYPQSHFELIQKNY